jgi:hypothetical protein
VHSNAKEGVGTSQRNWLKPFRGLSKRYLQGDVTAIEWECNRRRVDRGELWKILPRGGKEVFS